MDKFYRKKCWAKETRYKEVDHKWLHMSGLQLPCREEAMPEKTHKGVSGVPFLGLGEVTQGVHFVHISQAIPHDLCTFPYVC